jgi:predicted GNAT superfamily acetyltransferase
MAAVEKLARAVWQSDDLDVVPAHLLIAVAHNGGLVAGAFVEGKLVGFVFGFLGQDSGPEGPRLKHCSHQLGVDPAYRNLGLGFALKRFQWQFARDQGLERITWTYDPLLSLNAHFNIAKLGVVCSTYLRDVYGALRDRLNVGLPSDRFQVDWWINSERVVRRMQGESAPRLTLADYLKAGALLVNPPDPAGRPVPPREEAVDALNQDGEPGRATLLVEVPADFLTLKAADPALALTWRLRTRALFEGLFSRGYAVTDFLPTPRAILCISSA